MDSDVLNIADKNRRKQKDHKPGRIELIEEIAKAMCGEAQSMEPFKDKYLIWRTSDNDRVALEEYAKGTVRLAKKDAIISSIVNYSLKDLQKCPSWADRSKVWRGMPGYKVSYREATDIYRTWISYATPIEHDPLAFAEKSSPRLAFNRLDFDIDRSKDWATTAGAIDAGKPENVWQDIFARMTNWKAVAAFIGSIFIPDSNRQQYLYLYGDGGTGKSSLVNMIRNLIGPAFHSDSPQFAKSQFWTSSFIGKRLVVFSDCTDPDFPQSSILKQITGNDAVRCEVKLGGVFYHQMECKVMFVSNDMLMVSRSKADTRRAIYSSIQPFKGAPLPEAVFQQQLAIAAPDIVSFCVWMYNQQTSCHGPISVDPQAIEEIISNYDENYDSVLFEYFTLTADTHKIDREREYVSPHDFHAKLKQARLGTRQIGKFKQWLLQKYGITKKQVRTVDGRVEWRYLGLAAIKYYYKNPDEIPMPD